MGRTVKSKNELEDKAAQLPKHQHSSTSHLDCGEQNSNTGLLYRWAEEKSRNGPNARMTLIVHKCLAVLIRRRSVTCQPVTLTLALQSTATPGASKVSSRARHSCRVQ